MQVIRLVTGSLAALMAATIVYGFAAGDFGDEGGMILDLAWGQVTLIDLYIALALFGGWILLRERRAAAAWWFVPLVFLGSLGAALYAFIAAMRSDDVRTFLAGSAAS